MEEPEKYVAVIYDWNFAELDSRRQFPSKEAALAFARSATESAVIICQGNMDDLLDGKMNKPIAFYWCGEPISPE